MNSIDPDGRDVIHLVDGTAPFGSGGSGHTAVLIGDDTNGWRLYSKSGDNNPNGTAKADVRNFSNLQEFQDQYGKSGSYKYGYRVKTSTEQDKAMKEFAEEAIYTSYDFANNNCADFCRSVIESGGLNMGEEQTVFGLNYPYLEHQEFAANNPDGTNMFFIGEGQTPEDIESTIRNNENNRNSTRRSKNQFIFSQVVDKDGKIKVEEGTYKLDKNLKLKKQ